MPASRKRPGPKGLTSGQARRFYDRFGRAQDLQAFYGDRAAGDLVRHGRLAGAQAVLEAGCGTGRLAAQLLDGLRGVDGGLVTGALADRRLPARHVAPLLGGWRIEHHAQVSAWALTSEVVIASRQETRQPRSA